MDDRLTKPYDPKATEAKIYEKWESGGYFKPEQTVEKSGEKPLDKDVKPVDNQLKKDTFTIIMPPTNANGSLHAGHSLVMTIEDIMTRYKRMRGHKTLWVPGLDHAGFETQVVYEKKLEKEGRSRFGMDRDDLYKEILDFTLENSTNIRNQIKSMGASCDWSREKFTLDEDIVEQVQKTFIKMHEDGLIYRGKRLVNWCTKHQTSLSELETESEEKNDPLYYIKYGPFTVATVRPETIFGDVAIAVNPNDKRYKEFVGQEIEVKSPNGTKKLKVVADDFVDMEFGSGAVKVTPAHDQNDFEIAERHNLPLEEVIDQFGKLNEKTGKYAGMKVLPARETVVADLKEMDLIEKVDENYVHNVKTCYKCPTVIEPRALDQWYVKMEPLAQKAAKAVEEGQINFLPDSHRKIFLHWMNNPVDWNISRQIVWGIPIPAKICEECAEAFPDMEDKIEECPTCGGNTHPDTDTFDTWFSSGQWPFLALGYPEGKDYKQFYPTDVMESGSDLIFKWIPRMVFMSLYMTEKVPFHTVYLHGLILDGKGQKMSKSKGNVINPLELTEKFGTDALRMGLVIGNTPGTSLALSEDKIKAYKHFANKIWNASRFVLTNTEDFNPPTGGEKPDLTDQDKKYLEELNSVISDVTTDLENYRFYLAAEKVYHYFWHTFADVIIEETKKRIAEGSESEKKSAQYTLLEILKTSLALIHPFMPFVTEEVWSMIPGTKSMLIIEPWPDQKLT